MLKCYDEAGGINWVSAIRQLLCYNGFGYVWENEGTDNVNQFLALFLQSLKDQYLQQWHVRISVQTLN